MINRILLCFLIIFIQVHVMAANTLPIDTLGSKDASKPLVVYISGDGGFNSFSNAFVKEWNRRGYPIVALDAKAYFWKTKTPEIAAASLTELIVQYLNVWKRNQIILAGYSFGADVMPFIQMRLPASLLNRVQHTVLLSPSSHTDFTIHLFYNANAGSSVTDEINKLTKPALVLYGTKESEVSVKEISNKQVTILPMSGDHHYNNKYSELVSEIVSKL